jgi:TonB family protein
MHSGSYLVVAACLTLAGCGGAALLKEARPLESPKSLAEAKDGRILASIETVIVVNGPGSWAHDADWDEYLIRIRALSDEPMEIREIAIFDALDHRVEPGSDRGDLMAAARETERRYEQSGKLVRGGGPNGWVIAGAAVGGGAILAGSTVPFSLAAGATAGPAIIAVAAPLVLGVAVAYAGAGVVRLVNNSQVNSEIQRRRTTLPVALPRGAEASVDLFFPLTPLSGRTQVVYVDRHGEHRLDIDTRQALMDLDPAPTLVSSVHPKFPDQARRAGIKEAHVIARLTLDRQGHVQIVDVIQSVPSRASFEEEARQTLRWWTYSAGRYDGRTVEATLEFRR